MTLEGHSQERGRVLSTMFSVADAVRSGTSLETSSPLYLVMGAGTNSHTQLD